MKQNQPFKHAIAFVIGFGIVFTILGISVGVIGQLVPTLLPAIRVLGGILLIAFGLVTVGLTGWINEQIRARPSWQDGWIGNKMVRSQQEKEINPPKNPNSTMSGLCICRVVIMSRRFN